jgi:6,7-dimethyl-8-ribityllumazine synthase
MATKGSASLKKLNAGAGAYTGACVVLVKTEWNSAIVDELENGARKVLGKQGIRNLVTIIVPGAVEIPFAIKAYWDMMKYKDVRPDAFIALGTVIRGDTPHFDYVCKAVTDGVLHLNMHLPVPTIYSVLTVDNEQQAKERIGGKHGHKGEEAGITALKMISLVRSFKAQR